MTFLMVAGVGLSLAPQKVRAQACNDDLAMVEGSKQALVELKETVKKESLATFVSLNHQKSAVNKLAIHDNMMGELVSCLEKAAQDTTAPKEQAEAAKTQHDAAAKLLAKIKLERSTIKDASTPRTAKTFVENIELEP
ncbi:MAG: hypothetical protein WAO35_02405 [Terriglobia bacterium]